MLLNYDIIWAQNNIPPKAKLAPQNSFHFLSKLSDFFYSFFNSSFNFKKGAREKSNPEKNILNQNILKNKEVFNADAGPTIIPQPIKSLPKIKQVPKFPVHFY